MRVFEKDGRRVTTGSPTAAVDYLARGFVEIIDEPPVQRYTAPTPRTTPSDVRNSTPD